MDDDTAKTTQLPIDEKLIRLSRVKDLTGLPRTTIYDAMKAGTFPRNYALHGRAVVWRESEVRAWMTNIVRQSA